MFGQEQFLDINENLNRRFEEKKVLVALHRGAWGGNVIENTIPSFELALDMGADMFECDISRSTDGVLYAFHDGGEKRAFNESRNIQTMSSEEIDELVYYNSIGLYSGIHVERFETVLKHFIGDVLYNLDRSWFALSDALEMLRKYPHALKQMIIKTPAKLEYLDIIDACPEKYMYMPIVYNMKDVHTVLAYKNINLVGMEIIANSSDSELFQDENINFIKKQNLFIWVNAITLSAEKRHILFAGLDDDAALLHGYDKAWGEIIKKGADILQTDWPLQLSRYRDLYFGL